MRRAKPSALISLDEAVADTSLTKREIMEAEKYGDITAIIAQNGMHFYRKGDIDNLEMLLEGEDDSDDEDQHLDKKRNTAAYQCSPLPFSWKRVFN